MERIGVEVIVEGFENNPHCAHGPTALFKRLGQKSKEYFSCSAYRSHKDCTFYLSRNQKNKVLHIEKLYINHQQLLKTLDHVVQKSNEERGYCQSCNKLFVQIDNRPNHTGCMAIRGITNEQLSCPSELLVPKDAAQKEAQFFFSKRTVNDIMKLIERLNTRRALCIGTPRIHEFIRTHTETSMESLLLDIDPSYHTFYHQNEFVWFNMFNCHFFHESGLAIVTDYLEKKGNTIIVIDPPFGGRVELLAFTLNKLNSIYLKAKGKFKVVYQTSYSHMPLEKV